MNIGFIGLGIMGESMSANIVKKSSERVYVYDLAKEKIKKLEAIGAIAADSIEEIVKNSDVVFTMVPKNEHVIAVYSDILKCLKKDQIFVDMSTINPNVSIKVSKQIRDAKAWMLDAPVVKSKEAAIAGRLGIYVGGDEQIYNKVKHILGYMGENIIYLGDNGCGLIMKICHNMLVSQIQNAVNETISLAKNNGIGLDKFVTSISYGGGKNFYLDSKANTLAIKDYTTAFSVENMHKDVNIALTMMSDMNLDYPGLKLVGQLYQQALDQGYGKRDFSILYEVIEKNKNI